MADVPPGTPEADAPAPGTPEAAAPPEAIPQERVAAPSAAEPGPTAAQASEAMEGGAAEAVTEAVQEAAAQAVEDMASAVREAIQTPPEAVVQVAEPLAQASAAVVNAVEEAATGAAPEVESTTFIPATSAEAGSAEGGGEWELLLGKVQAWLGQGNLQAVWAQARTPLTLILAASALLVVLRVYTALLATIDSLPLIPGLLELVGVIWAVRFGVPKLVQRSQREELISSIQQRWQSFRGRS